MISLLLSETEAELRLSVITFYLCNSLTASIPYKVKIVNHIITFCMVNKCIGENYC